MSVLNHKTVMNMYAMTYLVREPKEVQHKLQVLNLMYIKWALVKAYVVGGQELTISLVPPQRPRHQLKGQLDKQA